MEAAVLGDPPESVAREPDTDRGFRRSAAASASFRAEVLRLLVASATMDGGHVLLVGAPGTGKTGLLDALTASMAPSRATFVRMSGDVSARELRQILALCELSLLLRTRGSPHAPPGGMILLVDDAHDLAPAVLERLIVALGAAAGPRFVVATRPALLSRGDPGRADGLATMFEATFTLPTPVGDVPPQIADLARPGGEEGGRPGPGTITWRSAVVGGLVALGGVGLLAGLSSFRSHGHVTPFVATHWSARVTAVLTALPHVPALRVSAGLPIPPPVPRPDAPPLLLLAEPGDTLPLLFARIYRGVTPPPYAMFVAANPGPIAAGTRIRAPAPPEGWVRR